jgi:hypothetical protein
MPSSTAKQARTMAAAAHNPAFAKKVGIPTSVAKEFNKADKGMKFKEGGTMKHDDIKQDMPMMKKVAGVEATKVVNKHEKKMHGMASGGKVSQLSKADGCAKQGKSKGTMIKMRSGGMC